MRPISRILRDPLTHFVLAGGVIFAAYSLVHEPDVRSDDDRTIVVDRDALLTFMQFQASAFEPDYFEEQFDALSPDQVRQLAEAYVREEAMEREARALGLDRSDYVIRRRLIQKIEFLVDEVGNNPTQPTETELRAHFNAHRADYAQPREFTFTHVFVDDEKDHAGGGEAAARRLLRELAAAGTRFENSSRFGDRFAYARNYVRRDLPFIANQFGDDFALSLASLAPSPAWQGPIRSQFGHHLILLTAKEGAAQARFEDVRQAVADDLLMQRAAERREQLIDELTAQYDVRYVGLPLPQAAASGL